MIPEEPRAHGKLLLEDLVFHTITLNRRLFNPTLLRHRSFDGHIVSMHQSGFHWLKNMLSYILIAAYDLPPMQHIQDNSIIGHTKSPPKYNFIPGIVHSHSHPHLFTLGLPFLHFPNYLVLVRDLRTSLISHYERFRIRYGNISFTEYLRGDIYQKKFFSDIYSRIRFLNEWGRIIEKKDNRITFVRYEDLLAEPANSLQKICIFFDVNNVSDKNISDAIYENSREKMMERANPQQKTNIVRPESDSSVEDYFDHENQGFFDVICNRYLLYDFGYNYSTGKHHLG